MRQGKLQFDSGSNGEGAATIVTSGTGTVKPGRLEFALRVNDEGRRVLYFPYMSRSDIHLGTQYARAKRTSHMEYHTMAGEDDYIGDIYDGVAVLKKSVWNLGPWHRQVIAHGFRKAGKGSVVTVFQGNHEHGINRTIERDGEQKDYRKINGKEIYGVQFTDEARRTDQKGRRILRLHGDKYDDHLFKNAWCKSFWYRVGDATYMSLYGADRLVRKIPLLEHFSLAAAGKKAVKVVINNFLGIRDATAQALDESEDDVMVYGHSHMAGFQWTPGGKLLINDGCCTEHVNVLVQDEHGTFAILTWHKDHMEVEEEPAPGREEGPKYKVYFKDIGFEEALAPAEMVEDDYTAKADRFSRLLYRVWPTKDRAEAIAAVRRQKAFIKACEETMQMGQQLSADLHMLYHQAAWNLSTIKEQIPSVPIPRRLMPEPSMGYPGLERQVA